MTHGRSGSTPIALFVFALTAAFGVQEAVAAPSGGTVVGNVKLASPSDRGAALRRGKGFTDRISNPLKPPKARNPLPEIVIVLQGGVADPSDETPGAVVQYRMIGESFDVPILPVLAGTSVDIHNDSRFEREFYSPEDESAFDSAVLPKKKRSLKKFGPAGKLIRIRVKNSPHIEGIVVAFEHTYFSRVDASGKFEIKGVPQGPWQIKVWYDGGWLKMPEVKVVVVANNPVTAAVKLPAKLETDAAPAPTKTAPEPEKKPENKTEGE